MRVLSEKDYKLLEQLVGLGQKSLKGSLDKYLRKLDFKEVITTKEYICAIGNIPIALVAHMDTVFNTPPRNIYYDRTKGVLWSPEGLGADDRAGVFAIMKILQTGLRPSIIFTTDEETGATGARALSSKPCPIPGLKYMIELDRRGGQDCVFYDCYVPEFTNYIESFGFVEDFGSFSDISYLMRAWKICGVNLSVGYEDEHSFQETLHIGPLYATIEKVKRMLSVNEIPDFTFSEGYRYSNFPGSAYSGAAMGYYPTEQDNYAAHVCLSCGTMCYEDDMFPVRDIDGKIKYFCIDCLVDERVGWCDCCGEAFITENPANIKLCSKCGGEVVCKTSNSKSKQ